MSSIGEPVLESFVRELEKLAFSSRANAVLGNMGALGGMGAAAGGLIGAGHGAIKSYRAARNEGGSRGDAAAYGILGGLGGVIPGALAGGAVGALGGAGAGALMAPRKAEAMRQALTKSRLAVGSQFGQRQVHGVTGWLPEGKGSVGKRLGQIGMGSETRKGAVDEAKADLARAKRDPKAKPSLIGRVLGRTAVEDAIKSNESALTAYHAAQAAENRGLTNIPGYIKALGQDVQKGPAGVLGAKGALRTAAHSEITGNPVNAAMMVGIPGIAAAQELSSGEDPEGRGRGRLRRAAGHMVGAGAGFALGPMPMTTQNAIQQVAGIPGRGLAKRRAARLAADSSGTVMGPVAHDLTADSGQAVPSERVVSERAAGTAGEGSPS